MRKLLIRFLHWLLSLLETKSNIAAHAEFVIRQIEEKFHGTSGEVKRAQALRMMLNITNASERECAKAIEEAVEQCLPR